ncbi:U3 snoRNP protein [Malassezia yamatoensis]|uniref:U3 snoRNP protein n=1 Tax=Malassezia yamatoensis TaxID=253288 RepID=A0AAJ5YS96_9BASI|nr:U3 snoRNP protein [Malassezia yamatoensis]
MTVTERSSPQAESLAERLSRNRHLLAVGDPDTYSFARNVTKCLFDQGVDEEKQSMPYISSLLRSIDSNSNRATQKRKRDELDGSHPLFPPTAIDELVLDGMDNEQIWQQLELRTSKLSRTLEKVMTSAVGEDVDDEENEENQALMNHDSEIVDDDSDEDWESEPSEEADEGFAGASDFSDLDADDMYYEPLRSENEQQKRKAQKEREELMNAYSLSDPAVLEALMGQGESAQQDDDQEQSGSSKSILDQLDDEPIETPASRKPRHPTLDDQFFSIDEFNRRTEAAERRDSTSKANLAGDDDAENEDEELDLFHSVNADEDDSEDQESDQEEMHGDQIMYSDFFDPPAKPVKASKRPSSKPVPEADTPSKRSVRFHDQVRVLPIKKAKPSGQVSGLIANGDEEEEGSEDEEDSEEEEHTEEEEDSEDEEEEVEDEIGMDSASNNASKQRHATAGTSGDSATDDGDEDDNDDDVEGEEDESESESELMSDSQQLDSDSDVEMRDASHDEMREATSNSEDESDTLSGSESGEEAATDATASRVANDLFADEPEHDSDYLSAYERRQQEIQQEIARYEDENVGEKDWTLMGEASSKARPVDSLLEEDLEFERSGKNAPIATQERSEGIDAMIKRRILDRQYDDVIRQRDMDSLPFASSQLLELPDTKNAKSLAELYEDEYKAARGEDSQTPQSESDAKLAGQHEAISQDLNNLFDKLDALSNAHYTPKAPKAAIQTVSNTPSIAMESALPTTMSAGSMLAPEEVYAASSHAPAMSGAKSEMTHSDKRRQHNQLRQAKRKRTERMKRAEEAIAQNRGGKRGNVKTQKDQALKSLMGNKGVSVVGKDSKKQDVKQAVLGKKPTSTAQSQSRASSGSASHWKL